MEAARRLLQAGEGSEIARIARSGLVGLRAMLADVVRRCPQDVGLAPGLDLIAQLSELLDGPESASEAEPAATEPQVGAGTRSPLPVGGRVPGANPALRALAAALADDPDAGECLDPASLAELREPPAADAEQAGSELNGDDVLWRALHLCLLRLPEQSSAGWRRKAADLAVAVPGEAAWLTLPGEADAVLVPPRPPAVAGVRTSPRAQLGPDVLGAIAPASSWPAADAADAAELARLSSLMMHISAVDPNLVLVLESVHFQGSRRLDDELRELYRADLLARLREYARRPPGSVDALTALIDLDEAVNSLTHRRPAVPGSWWAQLRQQSRRMVTRSADALKRGGADVDVLPLSLRYSDVRKYTRGNDVASRNGGEPGDVLACLRLWARIKNREIPGRVIYRI
jgi:hypothetical protein